MQIQQPSAEAAAAALCSAGALGSARAWSDRKQKERVNNGGGGMGVGFEAPFSTLFSFDSAQSHSTAYSSLQGGAQDCPEHTAVQGQPPSPVPCALPLKRCWGIWHKDLKNRESPCPTVSSEAHRSLLQSRHRISSLSGMKPFPTSEVLQRAQLKQLWCQ